MGADDTDNAAFEATVAGIEATVQGSIGFEETVVPNDAASWTTFRGSGRVPTIPVRYSASDVDEVSAPAADAELEMRELLGQGGMGMVYLATQRSLGRDVAVKTLRDATSPQAAAALYDEAVVTGRLSHPNVIPVHALGNAGDGRPLLVMKRVDGVGWNVLLRAGEHPFWARNEIAAEDRLHFHVEVLRKVTHAVAFAHSHGIVHRDIKPENVMIGDFGEVYLVDWGLAVKAGTDTEGKLAGTPAYLAPEMVGGVVDARTDVYLLGATLHEILTGAPPHRGTTLKEILHSAFVSATPTFAADVPDELGVLCRRALSRDPSARPATAQELGDAIDDHVRHRGSRALARTGEERLAQLRRMIEDVPSASRDLAELRRLVAESRFAFVEARRGWAENPAVGPGLRATLLLAVRAELDRRDAEAARAMLRELDQPAPDLLAAVDALDAELAREAEEHARHARLAHDLDPEVETGARVIGAWVTLAVIIALAVYVSRLDRITPLDTFAFAAVMFVGLAGLFGALWKRVKRTLFNRRLAAWIAVGSATLLLHRGLALLDPSATVESILIVDFAIMGAFWAYGSIFLFRWMLPVGIGMAACVIPAHLAPTSIPMLFSVGNAVAIGGFFVGWRRRPRSLDA